jgi:hypothetical protein
MANDGVVRLLSAMAGSSTSRMLNLHQIAKNNAGRAEFQTKPLFLSPIINSSFILKQRIRLDEARLFSAPRAISTKIIIPFDKNDLKAGGYSIFVDEIGFVEKLRSAGHFKSDMLERDLAVIKRVHALPSLDPFLLSEDLQQHNFEIAPCYFPVSELDRRHLQEFAERELSRLVLLAGGERGSTRFVDAMLSNQASQKLEPLRENLGLSEGAFREGVFSWRGFLYYKWMMLDFWPDVMKVMRDLNAFEPSGYHTREQKASLRDDSRNIIRAVRDNGEVVTQSLAIYDHAFSSLVASQSPKVFRDFLLSAPQMFLEMGKNLGAVSHIVELWNQRFSTPAGRAAADWDVLSTIFKDFLNGFGERTGGPIKKPIVS